MSRIPDTDIRQCGLTAMIAQDEAPCEGNEHEEWNEGSGWRPFTAHGAAIMG